MKCAAIIPSLRAGDVVNNCVTSMIAGGYDDDIYVVSQDPLNSAVTALGDKVRYVNTGTSEYEATDALLYKAFKALEKEYDILVYAHSDMTFHAEWWIKLKEAWDSVNMDKVWSISVPKPGQQITVTDPQQKLGLGFDVNEPAYRERLSPCTSYLYSSYADMVNKFGGETYFISDLLLFHESILKRKWALLANNGSTATHTPGSDTGFRETQQPGRFWAGLTLGYSAWFNLIGYNLGHFITTWNGCVLVNHATEIIDGVNSGNYDALDYIFDEAVTRLAERDCNKCGLVGSRPGTKCRAFGVIDRHWE